MTTATSLPVRVLELNGQPAQVTTQLVHAQPAYQLNPGQRFRLECDNWSAGRFLVCDCINTGEISGLIHLKVFARGNPATSPPDATPKPSARFGCTFVLFPERGCRFVFDFNALDIQRVFLPRTPGRLKAVCMGQRMTVDEIAHIELELIDVAVAQTLLVGPVTLQCAEPEPWVANGIFMDELGQWTARTWPGKTSSAAQMKDRVQAELAMAEPRWPESWSRFGGDTRKRFRATGFFRTERADERWWLVDPEGCAFWSAGLDCVRPNVDCALVPGTEKNFAWLPQREPTFADAHCKRNHWGQPGADFGIANLIRIFGAIWFEAWSKLTTRRLRAWRFNTVANWSNLEYARAAGLPYVIPMPNYPTTPTRLFRDLPDVFDPEFARQAQVYADYLRAFRGDPMLIGYFMTNEPQWGFGKHNLAAEMLAANPGTHARRALAEFLRQKYHDNLHAWRQAWNLPETVASFDALVTDCWAQAGQSSTVAYEDCWEFSRIMVRELVRIPAEACRRVDPDHLNLGTRWAWIASDLCYEGHEHVDVFSINCYQMTPDANAVRQIAQRTGKPVMIGEYHFGALDRGLPANGLRGVASQQERGIAYRRFLEAAAAEPDLVGVHYFTLNDEATLGRFDGENWQIGFVDVCQQPYPEIIAAAVASHERMYDVRSGSVAPFSQPAKEVPRVAT